MPKQATVTPSVRITPCGNTFRRASLAPTLKTKRFRRNPAPAAAVSRFRRWSEPRLPTLVFLLYQKGRDSRIFHAQDGYDRRDSEQQQVTADEDRGNR